MTVEKDKIDAVTHLVIETFRTVMTLLSGKEDFKKLDLETSSKIALEILLFLLHLCDRQLFCLVGSERRSIIMDGVLENVFTFVETYDENVLIHKFGEKTDANVGKHFAYLSKMALSTDFRNTYNERQTEYTAYKNLFAEKDEPLKDTVVWEAVKKIVLLVGETPVLMMPAMIAVCSDAVIVCTKTLKVIVEGE